MRAFQILFQNYVKDPFFSAIGHKSGPSKNKLPLEAKRPGSIGGQFPDEFPKTTIVPSGFRQSNPNIAVSFPTPS